MANVIKTVLTYPLDGSNRDFNIPFEYLARKFVVVTLIGVDRKVLTLNTDYRFATRTTISLTKAWGTADGYTTIELRRVTSTTDRLVDFTDGSILRAYDLNVAQIQTMHVAEEARDLTADTIGVNNDGHLDARGRRIVNLANAVDDRDAVPFGQLRTMNQNSWQARNEAQGFRDEAEQFRNQAEGFKNQAGTSASAAANSATNAAHSEATAGQHSTNASQSATSASNSAQSASTSETNAKNSELAAANSAAAASASEQNTKASASIVIQNVSSYGSLPVGSVVATPINKAPAGFLKLDGSRFNKDTYPSLFEFLGTDVLPDWRNRYLKGALNDDEVGVLKGWGLPARTGTARAAGGHNHSGTTSDNGNHSHSGSTSTNGQHSHNVRYCNGSAVYTNRLVRGGERAEYFGEDSVGEAIRPAGNHSHSFSTNTTGNHNHAFTTSTVGDHVHSLEIPAMGTGVMDVDHAKVHWWIKAFGTTNEEQMAQVAPALNDIHTALSTANSAKADVVAMNDRVRYLETRYRVINVPSIGGSPTWVRVCTVKSQSLWDMLTIRGTYNTGNNKQASASNQGISWEARVWSSNNNPKWVVSQVNHWGGKSDAPNSDMPVQGIAVNYEHDDYCTIYLKFGNYGSSSAVFVEGSETIMNSLTVADWNKGVVIANPPATAMAGFITFTPFARSWQSAL